MPTLGTYLTLSDAAAAIDFYQRAFGAEEVSRMPDDNGRLMHAELRLFGGVLMLADEFPEFGVKSPLTLGGTTFNLIISLDRPADVDAMLAKAAAAGGTITTPAADQFWGARFGMLCDPFGHMWGFIADLPK